MLSTEMRANVISNGEMQAALILSSETRQVYHHHVLDSRNPSQHSKRMKVVRIAKRKKQNYQYYQVIGFCLH